jgi:hypothetical protein
MRRALTALAAAAAIGGLGVLAGPAMADESAGPPCLEKGICVEPDAFYSYEGHPVGHDEPSMLFYSEKKGAGTNQTYRLRLPTNPSGFPVQDSLDGPIWQFQRSIAFWLGADLCDTQSAPEYTHRCKPGSDRNIFDDPDPASSRYVGKHPGGAFLELQFYPPGWSPWVVGTSCTGTQWCGALTIDSFTVDQNHGIANNNDCRTRAGDEPVNFAYVTWSGSAHAPASPLSPDDRFVPNDATDARWNPGDWLTITIKDDAGGLITTIVDETTGTTSSMQASPGNGFAQVNFEPGAATCSETQYAFRPMYATSSEHTRLTWTAHGYNVAYSDEIGHWQYCDNVVVADQSCADSSADFDDVGCWPADLSLLVPVSGCIGSDYDYDGVGYQRGTWPGSNKADDVALHGTPVTFTSPTFAAASNPARNYDRVAFETDTPRITAQGLGFPWLRCNRTTGENCTVVPYQAHFYPIYTTAMEGGTCVWREGGRHFPDVVNDFGGTPKSEYSPLLQLAYPTVGGSVLRYNDFRNVLSSNPCPFTG